MAVPVHAMNAYGEVQVQLRTFLSSAQNMECQLHVPPTLTPGNEHTVLLNMWLGGPKL